MSTRYVYSVYNTGVQKKSQISFSIDDAVHTLNVQFCNSYTSEIALSQNGEQIAYYKASPGSNVLNYDHYLNNICYVAMGTTSYKYIVVNDSSGTQLAQSYLLELAPAPYGAYWKINGHVLYEGGAIIKLVVWNSDSGNPTTTFEQDTSQKYNFSATGGKLSPTSLLYTETSSSKSKTEGAYYTGSSWRWRTYKGSDSIDPSTVTYSKQDLYPGEPVTITVTPVTPTYGGTVSYLYQYSIDGGSTWTTIGSKTTETSATLTIPEGAAQFQARVTASDGWGFTSTTPVKGPNLGVSQLKAYAAVSGISRAGVKMYATVDGKIREIQKGYATVGGKIRKLF